MYLDVDALKKNTIINAIIVFQCNISVTNKCIKLHVTVGVQNGQYNRIVCITFLVSNNNIVRVKRILYRKLIILRQNNTFSRRRITLYTPWFSATVYVIRWMYIIICNILISVAERTTCLFIINTCISYILLAVCAISHRDTHSRHTRENRVCAQSTAVSDRRTDYLSSWVCANKKAVDRKSIRQTNATRYSGFSTELTMFDRVFGSLPRTSVRMCIILYIIHIILRAYGVYRIKTLFYRCDRSR